MSNVRLFSQPIISAVTGYRIALGKNTEEDTRNILAENLILPSHYSIAEVDAFAVKLTGNQTVAGIKTFSNQLRAAAGLAVTGDITATGDIIAYYS